MKTVKRLLEQQRESYKVPRKAQDIIPIERIWPDGIFKAGNMYAKTFRFTDINFSTASKPDKEQMFLAYSDIINTFDSEAVTKITVNNRRLDQNEFERDVLLPMKGDGADEYRQELNDMLIRKAMGSSGIVQDKYLTVSIWKRSVEEARDYFSMQEGELRSHFNALGSQFEPLDAVKKLEILYDFYRPGDETYYSMNIEEKMKLGHDIRDYICPDTVETGLDYIKLGEKFARVFYLKDYANFVRDDIIKKLTGLRQNTMLSIDVISIPLDEAIRDVQMKVDGINSNIEKALSKRRERNDYNFSVPYDLEKQQTAVQEFMDELSSNDQRMLQCVLTLVITADTKEQLDIDTKEILTVARGRMSQLSVLKFQQLDGLNTVLPIGTRRIDSFRTLTTQSLAIFMPFMVQEIQEKGGMYLGENALSHNMILYNLENLMNQDSFIIGVPGSGKSMAAKIRLLFLILNTDDDILICDPEGEYAQIVRTLAPHDSRVLDISSDSKDRLNAMYMVEGYGEDDGKATATKSEFIMSMIERIDENGVGPRHKSIIDRCIKQVYREAKELGSVPTLCTLRDKLMSQREKEARDIALALELYTEGSFDLFGKQSNVDLDRRVIDFKLNNLSDQLKPAGLLVVTDTILNRVTLNKKRGKRTHVFIDEFHVLYENEYSAMFFNSAWRQFRKRDAWPTAITQNVEYLRSSVQASTMLSNSLFVVMMNQGDSDREILRELLHISDVQMNYITNSPKGGGLVKYGSALVPFVNDFPKDTKLYRLMTTKPGENGY